MQISTVFRRQSFSTPVEIIESQGTGAFFSCDSDKTTINICVHYYDNSPEDRPLPFAAKEPKPPLMFSKCFTWAKESKINMSGNFRRIISTAV